MDARLLDVIIGVTGFALLVILLAVLPLAISAGPAYLIAIIFFVLFLFRGRIYGQRENSLNESAILNLLRSVRIAVGLRSFILRHGQAPGDP